MLCRLQSAASYPLLSHLPPLAALARTPMIGLSCASPLLGHCFGLRTAVTVGFKKTALGHPSLAAAIHKYVRCKA